MPLECRIRFDWPETATEHSPASAPLANIFDEHTGNDDEPQCNFYYPCASIGCSAFDTSALDAFRIQRSAAAPNDDPCALYMIVEAPAGRRIRQLNVVCSSKTAEVFSGRLSEYGGVVRSDPEKRPCAANCAFGHLLRIRCDAPTEKLALKFFPYGESVDQQQTFHIVFGEIFLSVVKDEIQPTGQIDMTHVRQMLADVSLSQRAENLRQLLIGNADDASKCVPAAVTDAPSTTQPQWTMAYIDEFVASKANAAKTTPPSNERIEQLLSAKANAHNGQQSSASLLVGGVFAEMRALEDRLTKHIDECVRRQNEKLDRIIALLDGNKMRDESGAQIVHDPDVD